MERTDAITPARGRGLLSNANFWLLWWAVGISAFGDHLSELGLMRLLELDRRADQVRIQAQMTFAFFLPYFFLGPFAGWMADRFSRRAMMILADLVRAGIVASIPVLLVAARNFPVFGALAPLFFVGLFATLFSPARLSILPSLVRDEDLTQANSLINGLSVIAALISYVIGGVIAQHNPHLNFQLDALTFLASAGLVFFIVVPRRRVHLGQSHQEQAVSTVLRDVGRAFRYVLVHRRVLQLVVLSTVFWTGAAAFQSFIPTVVFRWYKSHHTWITDANQYEILGYCKGLLGVGMLAGALALTYFGDALRGQWVITWSLIFAGVAVLGFSATSNIYAGGLLAVAIGAFGAGLNISVTTLMQRIVPDRSLGRVFGIRDLANMGGLLTATGVLGLELIHNLDAHVRVLLVALGVVLLAVGAYSLLYRLRRSPVGVELQFYKNLNEFYAKWWFRCRRIGPCTIPSTGAVLVVANHTASIDPLLLSAASPHRLIGFMMARKYYRVPFFARIMRMINCVPVDREGQDLPGMRAALRQLQAGKALGIFPEGTIPAPGRKLEPKLGVAMLALRSDAAVIPAHISGTKWSDSVAWPFFRRHRARVRYGKPIDLSAYRAGATNRRALREVTELIMARIHELGPEASHQTPRIVPR